MRKYVRDYIKAPHFYSYQMRKKYKFPVKKMFTKQKMF